MPSARHLSASLRVRLSALMPGNCLNFIVSVELFAAKFTASARASQLFAA